MSDIISRASRYFTIILPKSNSGFIFPSYSEVEDAVLISLVIQDIGISKVFSLILLDPNHYFW